MRFIRLASTAAAITLVLMVAGDTQRAQTANDGKTIFRFDTFGDEQLWTDALQMQKAIAAVSPATALAVGLQVDSEALPPEVISALRARQVDLNDPRVTIQLLKLNAVVGVIGKVAGPNDNLVTIGVTCALCHSIVDGSIAPGIGKRLDGWPNLRLNVGAIIALSPALSDTSPYTSWGPGKYDPRFHAFDGDTFIPFSSTSVPVVIPPAYGLRGVGFETFTGDGPISYWNNYVAVTQMGGQGSFTDTRKPINLEITQTPDLVTSKLPALLQYQLSLQTPSAPTQNGTQAAAERGAQLFAGAARCSTCHIPPLYTDVGTGPVPFLHSATEIGADATYALRSATGMYRTTPLRALWQHAPYFHDGGAASLLDVVNHYEKVFSLGLNNRQKNDLVEFLKTL
jgi:hypothetical protein